MRTLVFALLAMLALPGCYRETYPTVALQVLNVRGMSWQDLSRYDVISCGTATDQILAIKSAAREAGADEWADGCLWFDRFGPFTREPVWPGVFPQWRRDRARDNPAAALDLFVWQCDSAGVEVWLRDQWGERIFPYGFGSKALLDMGPSSPVAEYMATSWLDSFSEAWCEAHKGWQMDDPTPWPLGSTSVCYETRELFTGEMTSTCYTPRQFRDRILSHVQEHFIEGTLRGLAQRRALVRSNGHYDSLACPQWGGDNARGEWARAMRSTCSAANLEGCAGGPGPCPQCQAEEWVGILDRLSEVYHPRLSTIQTKVDPHWSDAHRLREQRLGLALATIYGLSWSSTMLPPAWDQVPEYPPEAWLDLTPLGDTVFKRDPATKYRTLLLGEFSTPEFGYLRDNIQKFGKVRTRKFEDADGFRVMVIANPTLEWFGTCPPLSGEWRR